MRLIITFLTAMLSAFAAASPAGGCIMDASTGPFLASGGVVPSPPPPPGQQQTVLSAGIELFEPAATTTCVCGLGLGTAGSGLPASLSVDQVVITRLDKASGQHTVLGEFLPLGVNPLTAAGLAGGLGQLSQAAGWFGFSGQIQPFTSPVLGPEEMLTMSFVLSFDPQDLQALSGLQIQFAAGIGDPSGSPVFEDPEHHVTYFGGGELPNCIPTETALCLTGGRFRVEAEWRDFVEQTGAGTVVPCGSDESGLFYFFNPDNWELQIKVLDACVPPFDRYWVFLAGTTNVEFMVTVTDTDSGEVRRYFNPLGHPADAVTDTDAFATCL